MPLIKEILDNIGQAQVFSTLDLKNGFFHVEVAEDSKKYTSFVTHNSQYQFEKMLFGISNATPLPQQFQSFIQAVFKTLIKEKAILVYLDDIIIIAQTHEEAILKLKCVPEVVVDYYLNLTLQNVSSLNEEFSY